ncbi:hypothetical protein NKI31_26815 [Mesorhizobium sp. M0659]
MRVNYGFADGEQRPYYNCNEGVVRRGESRLSDRDRLSPHIGLSE